MRRLEIILLKSIAVLLLVCFAASVAFAGWVSWYFSARLDLPSVEKLRTVSPVDRICSSGGERTYVSLASVPAAVRNAVLAAEQPEFYDRWTSNPLIEIAHALVSYTWLKHRPRGAGITVPVTYCLMALSSRCCNDVVSIERHIGNLILMNRVDSKLSKDRIFEIYLNETYFGRGAYGVGAAAAAHFGKPVADLTLDEAASLAALSKAPNNYIRDAQRWTERRNVIIDRMQAAGAITPSETTAAKQQPVVPRPAPAPI